MYKIKRFGFLQTIFILFLGIEILVFTISTNSTKDISSDSQVYIINGTGSLWYLKRQTTINYFRVGVIRQYSRDRVIPEKINID